MTAGPRPKSSALYTDCREAFDAALANNGAVAEFPDRKTAISWRLRANRFRAQLRRELGVDATKYDNMVLRLEDNKVIFDMSLPEFKLTDLEGRPITTSGNVDELRFDEEDDELAAARAFAKKLGISDAEN